MTEQSKSNHSISKVSCQVLLWFTRLGVMGSIGILSSGMIWSHIPPDSPSQEAMAAPIEEPGSASALQPVAPQESAPVRIAEPQIPIEAPASEPAAPEPEPAVISTPSVSTTPQPETPEIPIVNTASPSPSASPSANSTGSTPSQGNAYIDSTNYNLGATKYEAPSSIVLSERSSGCQTVLQGGQSMPNGVCAPARSNTASKSTPGQAESPKWANRSTIPAPVAAPENISRRSSYPVASYSTVKRGFSLVPVVPLDSSNGYYNRTVRPVGRVGNGNINLLFPLSIPAPITSLFGWRTHPISGDTRFHTGTDLGAPQGTPVLAAFSGQVVTADFVGGYGLTVVIDHNKAQQQTLYGHLSEIFVQPGEWVEQGTVVGRVGSTGNSTGPHLHFELRQWTNEGWVAINADSYLEVALAQLEDSLRYAIVQVADLSLPDTLLSLDPEADAGFEAILANRRSDVGELAGAILPQINQIINNSDAEVASEVTQKLTPDPNVETVVANRQSPEADFEIALSQLLKVFQVSMNNSLEPAVTPNPTVPTQQPSVPLPPQSEN